MCLLLCPPHIYLPFTFIFVVLTACFLASSARDTAGVGDRFLRTRNDQRKVTKMASLWQSRFKQNPSSKDPRRCRDCDDRGLWGQRIRIKYAAHCCCCGSVVYFIISFMSCPRHSSYLAG
ncbi:unnamed protein product, partial [Sphacelaria rigidula]